MVVEADIVRNKQELIDTVHDSLSLLQGGDGYMNQQSYPASSSLQMVKAKKKALRNHHWTKLNPTLKFKVFSTP